MALYTKLSLCSLKTATIALANVVLTTISTATVHVTTLVLNAGENEIFLASSLSQEPGLFERRATSHRTQRTLPYDQATTNSLINSHMDEIFRRLDLIQNISDEQHTSSADTRVRLQSLERRARRLYRELQGTYEENTGYQAPPSATVRAQEATRDPGTYSQSSRIGRRRLTEIHALELGQDPYSPMDGAEYSTNTVQSAASASEDISVRTNTSSDRTFDSNREPPPPPPEYPISPNHYAEYLRWGEDLISDDDLPSLRYSPESSAIDSDFARV
ncbi:hypothetical protein G6011_07761 [Alternaria panax]|uniref:Uncharacterized protein n=1 Tax=Alternaria panax TaxID=48097 RepID=A0AAD4I4P5_9PLEO|nr:hypothetical protein G6011_07761 [Alternaria panax]